MWKLNLINFFYYLFKRMKNSTIVRHMIDHAFLCCFTFNSRSFGSWCCGYWYDIITWKTTFSSTWIKSYPMLFVTCLTWLCCYRIRSHEFFQINNENSTHVWHDIINISPNTIYPRAEPYLFSFLYLETKMRLCLQGEPQ